LAEQQQQLRARLHELMSRLSELPDQAFQEPGSRAQQAMEGAQRALESGATDAAAVREREAAEQLEQASEQLAGDRDRYEQLRQEEVLFRVGEELAALHERQVAIGLETRELDDTRRDRDRLGRSQARAVARLSGEERGLSVQAEALRAALEQDGAIAFTFALQRTRDDLQNASGLLADEQTGVMPQLVQADVVRRLEDLMAVLDAELERRRNAELEEPQEGQPQGQQPSPPLVPTVAELLLVQRMEQAALARLENFIALTPTIDEEDGLVPVERELLERWALEHRQVTELFRRMIPDEPEGEVELETAPAAGSDGTGGPGPEEPR
jgi:hypothetical protein